MLLIGIAVGAPKGSEKLLDEKEEHLDKEDKDYKLKEGEADVAGLHLNYLVVVVVFLLLFFFFYLYTGWLASKSCIDSGKLLQVCQIFQIKFKKSHTFLCIQCTKSAKSICPEDKLKKEEVDLEEKEKTCIDSAKLLRCIRSVRIVCPKSTK